MSSLLLHHLLFLVVVGVAGGGRLRAPSSLEFHHRFSSPLRRWAEERGHVFPGGWPEHGSTDYVAALAGHDRRRALSASDGGGGGGDKPPPLTFSEGNATLKVSNLGFLHYALVTVGTPGQTFMVALDTGSDLFWLPCQCDGCTPPASAASGSASFYIPSLSSTSQEVPCNSEFCELRKECSTTSQCPYKMVYVSADTSSSGFLVKDVLYLSTEGALPQILKAQILFGCGQIQTGSFLDAAAPNGLFGLGIDMISIPSILAQKGLISNSFAMCFSGDGIGRISFGDQGSSDQEETPLDVNPQHPTYTISITEITVGNSLTNMEFSTIFDTGTSFTYLADPAYTYITQSFHAQVQANRHAADSRIPFEYCYDLSSSEDRIQTPSISLRTVGGGVFPVIDEGQIISIQQHEYVYCLAIVKSAKLNIIGQNFMTGLRVVFDRERKILGWKKFNCFSPSAPENYSPQETKGGNPASVTQLRPLSNSSPVMWYDSLVLKFLLVHLAILV
ncbi:aspartyl protease family protein 1 isoform X2 [Oryza brachyantha]|uniref:aspartyl protease family protein 1 isoform X2 n=1 Tax=Oryza brachyantha TaxID=4533 RepID=UPI001ADAC050|nr:aspartyl protease family protein 1 isoform X2 [Oryza brachyantha]